MADSYIAIDEPATVDKKLDTETLTVGANTVERERVILSGAGATDFALPVAHDAADAGNPLKIGGRASAAAPTDVSAGNDRVNAWFLLNGAQAAVITAAGALIGGDATNGLDVDVTRSALPSGASTSAKQDTQITAEQAIQVAAEIMDDWDNTASDGASVSGDVAHDGVDAGEPVKVGVRSIAFGANPTAVAAADRSNWYGNRHGVPFVLNGHPFIKSAVYINSAGITDDNIMPVIAGGTKYVVTGYSIFLDEATTVTPGIRLGFGTANVPALPSAAADAVDGILEYHPGMVPGTGIVVSGVLLAGGDGEELRITCDAATGGSFVVRVHYFTIES